MNYRQVHPLSISSRFTDCLPYQHNRSLGLIVATTARWLLLIASMCTTLPYPVVSCKLIYQQALFVSPIAIPRVHPTVGEPHTSMACAEKLRTRR